MGWRDTLQRASFRGVEFFTTATEHGTGRRTVRHDFPGKDEPFFDDLGRKAREFQIDAFVIGPEYHLQRNLLLAAIEAAGPGLLVHPYRGRRYVICSGCSVRESADEGGLARFSLTFVETALAPPQPSAAADTKAVIEDAADTADSASAGLLGTVFSVIGMAQYAVDSAKGIVSDFTDKLNEVLGPVKATAEAVADLKHAIDNVALDIDALIRSPFELAEQINDLARTFATLPATPSLKLSALLDTYGFTSGDDNIPVTTASRIQQQTNQDALQGLMRRAALTSAVIVARESSFDSYEEAVAARDTLADLLDTEAEAADNDDVFTALIDLRAALVTAIPGRNNDLARISTFTPILDTQALVIAHELYGDALRDAEIIARNNIRNPNFVPGGKSINVLTE